MQSLRQALDEVLAMNEQELFADMGKPESKYYFSELGQVEKIWCDEDSKSESIDLNISPKGHE